MILQDIQFIKGESDDVRTQKLRVIVDELARLRRGTTAAATTAVTATDAAYIVAAANVSLPNARVLSAINGLELDVTVANSEKVGISQHGVALDRLAALPLSNLIGASSASTDPRAISLGSGLAMSSGGVLSATAVAAAGYPPQLGYAQI